MKTMLEQQSDRQLLEELQRLGSATVPKLCDVIGVTPTAIRQRLTRLCSGELVTREVIRAGRGRPRYIYSVTDAGLRLLGENYGDLALILWQELRDIQDPDVRQRLVDRVREALVQRYGNLVDGPTLRERMAQLKEALANRGFRVEADCSGALPVLRENNCPYPELASQDSSICQLEQEVFEQILGQGMTLSQCCLDGDSCCEFQAVG